jgi:hypothetical protein
VLINLRAVFTVPAFTVSVVSGSTVPIPTKPSPLKLRTFVPPAISEPVSAPAQPIPVFLSPEAGPIFGSVEVASEKSIHHLFVAPCWISPVVTKNLAPPPTAHLSWLSALS